MLNRAAPRHGVAAWRCAAFPSPRGGKLLGYPASRAGPGLRAAHRFFAHQPSRGIMIHELRIYHCMPGRLPDLNQRFATITLKMWEKHGIRQVGFWTVLIGPSNHALYYMLEWDSLAEREQKWNAFSADPDWIAARSKTEAQGAIVRQIENYMLAPTAYSKI
jgi:hypothetical protein